MVNITPTIWDPNISFLRNINNNIFITNQHFPLVYSLTMNFLNLRVLLHSYSLKCEGILILSYFSTFKETVRVVKVLLKRLSA